MRVRVHNLGVSGYNTRQEIRALELNGPRLKPDVVIVAYCLNDPESFTGDHVRHFHPPHLEILYYLGRAAEKVSMHLSGLDYFHYFHDRLRENVAADIAALARVGKVGGYPIVLAVVPVFDWRGTTGYAYEDIHLYLRLQAEKQGLAFVDLWPAFKGKNHRDVSIDFVHPNPAGHKLIADALVEVLVPLLFREG